VLVGHHRYIRHVLPRGYRRYRVPGGRLYLDLRESPMMLARAIGAYEPEKMRAFRDHLKPGMTVADVGANKGDFTLLAASLVGPTGRVIAFEPDPDNQRWLNRSVEASGYRNIDCVQAALGKSPGTATLHRANRSGWHTMLPGLQDRSEGQFAVQVRTLDEFAPLDAVKIDVEGFEEQVLLGASRALAGPALRVVFLDLHPQLGVDVPRTLGLLADAGFKVRGDGVEAVAVR
jgi:FkbM family methyltransferase